MRRVDGTLTGSQFRSGFKTKLIDRQPMDVLGYIILPVLLFHVYPQDSVHFFGMGQTEQHQE